METASIYIDSSTASIDLEQVYSLDRKNNLCQGSGSIPLIRTIHADSSSGVDLAILEVIERIKRIASRPSIQPTPAQMDIYVIEMMEVLEKDITELKEKR